MLASIPFLGLFKTATAYDFSEAAKKTNEELSKEIEDLAPESTLNTQFLDLFNNYCFKKPRGHVLRSVRQAEILFSEHTFGEIVVGMSVGVEEYTAKAFQCQIDKQAFVNDSSHRYGFMEALSIQLKMGWRNSHKKWSTA